MARLAGCAAAGRQAAHSRRREPRDQHRRAPAGVADRIVRYAKVVGRENVIAGTDCGFGGRIHPQIAWAKLEALAAGAKLATAELWK